MNPRTVTIETYGRFYVVRDDLLPGGSKARFLPQIMQGAKEVVYAGPAWGGAEDAGKAVGAASRTD